MAKIILIDPYGWQGAVCGNRAYPNVGIAYLVAALRKHGHDALIIDLNNVATADNHVISAVEQYSPHIIGFSLKTATIKHARSLGQKIKGHFPDIPIILGGPHTTIAWQELVKEPWPDVILIGEGEGGLPIICSRFLLNESVTDLAGIVTKVNLKQDPGHPLITDLDALAFPEYDLFSKNVKEFIRDAYPMVTSRGCVYKCTYCSVPEISGRMCRRRSCQNIIAELKQAQQRYGISGFEIIDDVFNLDIKRCKEICQALIESGLQMKWACPNGLRADRVDKELADLMFKSGCRSVMVGIESADPIVFASINKGETIDDVERGIRIFKKAGMEVGGYFIIGLPGDSFDSEKKSVRFARRMGIDALFNMLVPYPGTQLWEWAKKNARFVHNIEDRLHFADSSKKVEPVIETDDFSILERQRAYEMAHTRLKKFDMIIPKDVSKQQYYFQKFKLIWRYDKIQLPSFVFEMLFGRIRRIFKDIKTNANSRDI